MPHSPLRLQLVIILTSFKTGPLLTLRLGRR